MVNDILLDETGDLAVSADGDLVVGFSDSQHISNIIESAPGNYKQHPLTGVEIMKYINSPVTQATKLGLKKAIRTQLEFDAVNEVEIEFENGQLDVRGEYEL